MVLIENKSDFLQKIERENDLFSLKEYLWNKIYNPINDTSNTVEKLIFTLNSKDILPATEIIEDYSKRQPNSESSYINNDLLIFLLICVIKKFNLETNWLTNFIEHRKSEEHEKNSITKTFHNILENNFSSKDNYFEIIIVYKEIIGNNEINESTLNETYEKLARKTFPFYESHFLNLVALRTIDLIVLRKGLNDYVEFESLKKFSNKFDNRIALISNILSWFCVILFVGLTGYILSKVFYGTEEEKNWFNQIFTVLGFIGISLTSIGKKKIQIFFNENLKTFLGKNSEQN